MQDEYRDEYHENTDGVKRSAKKMCSRLGFSFAAFMGVTLLVQIGMAFFWREGFLTFDLTDPNLSVALSMGSMYACGFPVCYLICRGIGKSEPIEKRGWGAGKLAVSFLVCMGVLYVGNIIGQILMALVSVITGNPMVNNVQEMLMNVSPLMIFALTVVVAPITEELIFRKMLIDRTVRYGQGVSIVLSGVMFGLAHGNFYQFFYACGLGMVFAYIYMNTGRIRYTIMFHMIINFLGSIVPLSMLKLMADNIIVGSMITLTYGALILGCIIASIVLLIVYGRRIVIKPGVEQIPRGSRFKTLFLNVGMIAYLMMCVVLFVIG